MTYFKRGRYSFSFFLYPERGRKLAGEISTRCFPCWMLQAAQRRPALETCRHRLWLATLHTLACKNHRCCCSGRGGEKKKKRTAQFSFEESVYLSLRPWKPRAVIESFEAPELPWVLCCGCLIGSVIHTHHTPHGAVGGERPPKKVFVCFFFFPLSRRARPLTAVLHLCACTSMSVCLWWESFVRR